jgi:hypothetical protein
VEDAGPQGLLRQRLLVSSGQQPAHHAMMRPPSLVHTSSHTTTRQLVGSNSFNVFGRVRRASCSMGTVRWGVGLVALRCSASCCAGPARFTRGI